MQKYKYSAKKKVTGQSLIILLAFFHNSFQTRQQANLKSPPIGNLRYSKKLSCQQNLAKNLNQNAVI